MDLKGNDVIVRADNKQVLADVIMSLERNGTFYDDVQIRRSTLEDDFLSLTGRRLEENGEAK